MYVGSKKRTSKKKPKTRYKTRTVTRKEGGDKVYYFGGATAPVSSEKRESTAPAKSRSGSSMVAPIVGLALIGGAAAGFYWWYSKNKCPTPNEKKTIDGVCKTCLPFPDSSLVLMHTWQDTPGVCDDGGNGGGTIKGDPCGVIGSGYCKEGKYYICKNDGYAWYDGTPCTGENCLALNCGANNYICGGVVEGDADSDYYYDYRCNPVDGKCNFMKVTHNSIICAIKVSSVNVKINGQSCYIGDVLFPVDIYDVGTRWISTGFPPLPTWELVVAPDVIISVEVKDQFGRIMKTVPVNIIVDSGFIGNLMNWEETTGSCHSASGFTGDDGVFDQKWQWTWNTGDLKQVVMTVKVYDEATLTEMEVPVKLNVHGHSTSAPAFMAFWTYQGYHHSDAMRCKE